MLLPSIFGESLLDEFFDHPHQRTHFQSHASEMMRTDVKDLGNVYEMTMNLPGIPSRASAAGTASPLRTS